jgi:hypothetical protein
MEENPINTLSSVSHQQRSTLSAGAQMANILVPALMMGILGDYLLHVFPWGINVTLFVCLLTGLMIWEWLTFQETAACVEVLLIGCLFSIFLAWRDSTVLKSLNLLGLLGILLLICSRPTRRDLYSGTLPALVVNALRTGAKTFVIAIGQLTFQDIDWTSFKGVIAKSKGRGLSMKILRALFLTLPIVIVFSWLLASADKVFKQLLLDLFLRSSENTPQLFYHVLWIGIIAGLVAIILRTLLQGPRWLAANLTPPELLRIGGFEVVSVLGSLLVLFATFIFVQFRYWFGGVHLIRTISELTYAGYLHSGFYQLLAVVALLHLILLIGAWLVKVAGQLTQTLFQGLSFALILLNYFILASAFFRLHIYIKAYGMTILRFYVAATLVWSSVVFLLFLVKLLRPSWSSFTGAYLYSIIFGVLALNLINPDARIAQINLERTLKEGKNLDMAYLQVLSADAVPTILEYEQRLPEFDFTGLKNQFSASTNLYAQSNWRSWNYSRSKTLRLILSTQSKDRKQFLE